MADRERDSCQCPCGLNPRGRGFGFGFGIFFIGYVLFQMPGGYLAQVWSAKRFIFWALLVWGVFATLCGLVQTYEQLLVCRFLLGVGEGGVWPATVVLVLSDSAE